jgi:hypothetical protein
LLVLLHTTIYVVRRRMILERRDAWRSVFYQVDDVFPMAHSVKIEIRINGTCALTTADAEGKEKCKDCKGGDGTYDTSSDHA